ncbi:MAG TPA: hemerythrin domain-containing protein [Streptosporangiaceae bacterium]|nr:hemerythrin domain-containing protein [Streptosporangiaceae bacterium]
MSVGAEAQPPSSRGEAMVAELKWVHDLIRRDLQTVRRLAADVRGGMPAGRITAGIRSLATGGPLWQLRINCLQYCRFVHSHHHAESAMLFPVLRRINPALGPVVDKLEADHAQVAGLLDDVEAAAGDLASQDDPAVRQRLTAALEVLSTELLAHLAYEEDNMSDTMRGMTGWPGW